MMWRSRTLTSADGVARWNPTFAQPQSSTYSKKMCGVARAALVCGHATQASRASIVAMALHAGLLEDMVKFNIKKTKRRALSVSMKDRGVAIRYNKTQLRAACALLAWCGLAYGP